MALGIFHFQVLTDVIEKTHHLSSETELADVVLSTISKAFDAEAGSIFKVRPDETLEPLASYGVTVEVLRQAKFKVGEGVAGWVALFSRAVRVENPQKDPRFMGRVDVATGFKTRGLVAAPILSGGKCIGVIEFLNRRGGAFSDADLDLVTMVGRVVGTVFENASLIDQLEAKAAFQEAIISSLSAGVMVVDPQGSLVEMNPVAERILRPDAALPMGKFFPVSRIFPNLPQWTAAVERVARSEEPIAGQEARLVIHGQNVVIGFSGMPIRDKQNKRLGSVLLFQDITAKAAG
ncbi:MAG: GAF domain-containing protein [Elusimicrobia bacterium]|nr:GAF domain-containing protein [Elusimicrobiota bacterium]